MKKIFPVITILILLSLLGLIFFQFLWIKSAREAKDKQVEENIIRALGDAAIILTQEHSSIIPLNKRSDLLFPGDKLQLQYLRPSIKQRFSMDEIHEIIRRCFNKNNLHNYPFEFRISDNSLTGEHSMTENYFQLASDTFHNRSYITLLAPQTGSSFENLTMDEYLSVIVPNQKSIVWKEMIWFIIGAVLFTLIITTAFFITIRTLLKQKKLSEIKSDFINNMTHEFKTPLATISLAVDALKNEKVKSDVEKTGYFTGIIKEENKRMNKQVETILQAALLDKQEIPRAPPSPPSSAIRPRCGSC